MQRARASDGTESIVASQCSEAQPWNCKVSGENFSPSSSISGYGTNELSSGQLVLKSGSSPCLILPEILDSTQHLPSPSMENYDNKAEQKIIPDFQYYLFEDKYIQVLANQDVKSLHYHDNAISPEDLIQTQNDHQSLPGPSHVSRNLQFVDDLENLPSILSENVDCITNQPMYDHDPLPPQIVENNLESELVDYFVDQSSSYFDQQQTTGFESQLIDSLQINTGSLEPLFQDTEFIFVDNSLSIE